MNSNFIEDWHNLKLKIAILEKKCNKYREKAKTIMDENETNHLNLDNYIVERIIRQNCRILKGSVPQEIWDEYATMSKSSAFYVKKKKQL